MATRTIATIDDSDLPNVEGPNQSQGGKPEPQRIAGFEIHNPADGEYIDGGTDRGTTTRRRGRPPGTRNKSRDGSQTASPQNIAENLEHLLLSVHTMGAAFLKCPELELDEAEAKKLASSIREVSKHYPVTLDPKRLALIELGTMAAMIYGTRGVAIYKRLTATPKPAAPKPKQEPTPINKQPASQPAPSKPPGPGRPLNPSDLFFDNGVEDLSQL